MVAHRGPLQESVPLLSPGWIAIPGLIAAPATSCFRSQETSCQFQWLGVQIQKGNWSGDGALIELFGAPLLWWRGMPVPF